MLGWALVPLNFQPPTHPTPVKALESASASSLFVLLLLIIVYSPLQKKYVHIGLGVFLNNFRQPAAYLFLALDMCKLPCVSVRLARSF